MAFCPNCDADIAEDSVNCAKCGALFSEEGGWLPSLRKGVLRFREASGAETVKYTVYPWSLLLPLLFGTGVALNSLTLGIVPGAPLFSIGDSIAIWILGTSRLPPFHGDHYMTIFIGMGTAWSLLASVISLGFALHGSWSSRKCLLFLVVLAILDVGLAAHFHLGALR